MRLGSLGRHQHAADTLSQLAAARIALLGEQVRAFWEAEGPRTYIGRFWPAQTCRANVPCSRRSSVFGQLKVREGTASNADWRRSPWSHTLPNLTIKMMVKLGPWTFLGIDDKGFDQERWEHCQIQGCGEHIRYVHVCQLDADSREWRIGSTCGPTLIQISEEVWGRVANDAARNLKLLLRAERVKELESGPNAIMAKHLGNGWVDEIIAVLKSGKTDGRTLKLKTYASVEDLKIIQLRLAGAEKLHKLKPYKMGRGA